MLQKKFVSASDFISKKNYQMMIVIFSVFVIKNAVIIVAPKMLQKTENLIVKRVVFLFLLIILLVELHSFFFLQRKFILNDLCKLLKARPLMKPSAPTDCRIPCHTVSRRRLS